MDDMHPKKYWRHNSWSRKPINIFRLKRKRYDGNYKVDEIDCGVSYGWLDKKYHYSPDYYDDYASLKEFLNHKANKRPCGINEIYLFKLIYLNSICQN